MSEEGRKDDQQQDEFLSVLRSAPAEVSGQAHGTDVASLRSSAE